ncbi:UDP-sulfoquinovose synthase [Sulfurisphaera ohwakuensis]|uniref:NAD-dependent epimerase/dehydratase family protein n=1 Tax=Sulfurisphaera ohwakuensis TaxID=69656 RepID=A0A650CJM5_SULOH|nr:UDP-sulfoquinovose synthase [Sulfurisphaera ohwakuensis]MBB5253918.1 nucleoside-diphosphate-sugar epimerase [Sulfurisphaera ohwakuensis]QGR17979.1 NAD-dependent epimerase/dehydratase family protein [Sulfurisphaera ohwakuensis]
MRILILGIDGYLGWPLALRLAKRGHEVIGIDNLSTRRFSEEVGSDSAFPLPKPEDRVREAKRHLDVDITFYIGDVTDYNFLTEIMKKHKPDAIVHFAEQRSAPYSMKDRDHAVYTVVNNEVSTLNVIYAVKQIDPTIHILKMGTMGEYGTPNFDIPESIYVEAIVNGKKDKIIVPRKAGSVYHWTKVHDTDFLLYFHELWGLTVTDIMQGPVYGTRTEEIVDESLRTRFDFDETWGTVVNRFCVQAILGIPLTVYGKGGQTRGFISLEDSMEALTLLLEHPPNQGEYRVANQFAEIYSVRKIAEMVKNAGEELGLKVEIGPLPNPRVEAEEHYYNPERKVLPSLGFYPKKNLKDELKNMIKDLLPYRERLERYKDAILPKTKWRM